MVVLSEEASKINACVHQDDVGAENENDKLPDPAAKKRPCSSTSISTVDDEVVDLQEMSVPPSNEIVKKNRELIVSLMDLTSLGDNDTEDNIADLAKSGTENKIGKVAALCVFPQFIQKAKLSIEESKKSENNNDVQLDTTTRVATVVNFPHGESDLETVKKEIQIGLEKGADEIDLVIPWKSYVENPISSATACVMVKAAREAIPDDKVLKVIIESGSLEKESLIRLAAKDAIENGADFIKTSTGKVKVGATLAAAKVMLEEIHSAASIISDNIDIETKLNNTSKKRPNNYCGFKASGGIRTYKDAIEYINLAREIVGEEFLTPARFRFGVSGLLNNLVKDHDADDVDEGTGICKKTNKDGEIVETTSTKIDHDINSCKKIKKDEEAESTTFDQDTSDY